MANEATIIELFNGGRVMSMTCGNTFGISGLTLLGLEDARTISGSYPVVTPAFAGVAQTEKVAGDGSTTMGVYTDGVFDIKTGGDVIACGAYVSLSGSNIVKTATEAEIAAVKAVGRALETSSAGEVIAVRINI